MSPPPAAMRPRIHWPALLTIGRVVLVVPVVVLTLRETPASSWVAFVAFGVAALTDGLDGFAARRLGLVSDAGKTWDPIADKILVLAAMAALVVVERFPLWAAVVIVVREAVVTALRLLAARRGHAFAASFTGKVKTALQLVAVLLYILPAGTVAPSVEQTVLILAVIFTLVSGAQYLMRAPALITGR